MREQLAELAHDQWSRWMKHLFSTSQHNEDGSVTIPAWAVERWTRQMTTSYGELTDAEKQSDQLEADNVIRVIEYSCHGPHTQL